MGVALYPEFEVSVAGYSPSTAISGKALARAVDAGRGDLEISCRRLGVVPIFEFWSESNAEAFSKIGELLPPDLPQEEPLKWSEPAEGLRTVETLLSCPDLIAMPAGVREDLESLRAVLLTAADNGSRFRLRLDI